jgi:hypothetical protein
MVESITLNLNDKKFIYFVFYFFKKINEKFSYFGPQLLTPMSMGILLKSSSRLFHFFYHII